MARIEKSIDVNVPLQAVYIQLTEFEEYPSFMDRVEEVRLTDDSHVHWRARKRDGSNVEWDAELTELVPDRSISWRTQGGPRNSGRVELQPLDDDHTRLRLTMEYEPNHPGADAEQRIGQHADEDLERFKKFVERLPHHRRSGYGAQSEAGTVPPGVIGGDATQPGRAQAAREEAAYDEIGKTVGRSDEEWREATGAAAGAGAAGQHAADGGGSGQAEAGGMHGRRGERGRPPWLPNLLQGWEEPLSRVRKMSEEVDELAQRYIRRPLYGSRARQGGIGPAWTPAVEISKQGAEFVVCAEVPGVRREDVQIEIKNDKLTIEGDRHQPSEPQAEYRRSERSYGHFYRVIALPDGADEEGVKASMQDGLLEIRVPLSKEGQPGRRVDIG